MNIWPFRKPEQEEDDTEIKEYDEELRKRKRSVDARLENSANLTDTMTINLDSLAAQIIKRKTNGI